MTIGLEKRWIVRRPELSAVGRISRELGLSQMTAALLVNRGITDPEEAHRFLNPSLAHLHDPFLMRDMRKAVGRILRAIQQKEKILVYGDYDVDGTTSTVILKKALSLIGADVAYYIPERLKDGYGMRLDAMDRAKAEGFSLVISVDTGIRASQVVEHARQIGLDVIITDHHLPERELPRAEAVLNPKRGDCSYPYKDLAGCGVAFKLAQALLQETGRARLIESFVKIAAIGTIADIVPLLGENRVIAWCGLEGLSRPANPGLRALMEVAGILGAEETSLGRPLSTIEVSFRLAPRINAAGRMGGSSLAVELFDASDLEAARQIARQMNELNAARQRAEAELIEQILSEIERDPEGVGSHVAVIAGRGWHRGVIGIAASKVVEQIYRPTIIISVEQGLGHGSGRSIPAFHLLEALSECQDLFERFGGHRGAAGLVLRADRIDELRRRLNKYAAAALKAEDLIPTIEIDMELPLRLATFETFQEVCRLEPFGLGNPEPVFSTRDAQVVSQPRVLKDRHLKFRVLQAGKWADCLWWKGAGRAADIFPRDRLNLAFKLMKNTWDGKSQIELELVDARISS